MSTFKHFLIDRIRAKFPVWIYTFTRDGVTSRFTAAAEDFTYSGDTYTATPGLHHGRIKISGELSDNGVDVHFPLGSTFAEDFLARRGTVQSTLVIRQGWANDPGKNFNQRFSGRFVGARINNLTAALRYETAGTLLRQGVDAGIIQQPCRHVLYSQGVGRCNAVRATFTKTETVTAIDGDTVTVTGAASEAADYYSGGILKYGAAERWILKHDGGQLLLEESLPALDDAFAGSGSESVDLSAGCPLTRTACNDRFANIVNFGGFPFIADNPFHRSVF